MLQACLSLPGAVTAPDPHPRERARPPSPWRPLAAVYKGMCKRSRETVVLKSYALSSICELYQHQIFREVRLHASLQHENIIKLYAAFKVRGAAASAAADAHALCMTASSVRAPCA